MEKSVDPKKRRPIVYVLFCLASATYHGLLSLIFALAFFLSITGNSVLQKYSEQYNIPLSQFSWVTGLSLLGFVAGLTGSILLWKMRLNGLWICIFSFLIILGVQLYNGQFNHVYIVLNIVFLAYFFTQYKRIRQWKSNPKK